MSGIRCVSDLSKIGERNYSLESWIVIVWNVSCLLPITPCGLGRRDGWHFRLEFVSNNWLTPHPSPLTPHPSPLTPNPHPLPLTPHPSPLTPHPSPLTPHPLPLTPHPSPPTPHPRNRPAVWPKIMISSIDLPWYCPFNIGNLIITRREVLETFIIEAVPIVFVVRDS